jgi:hypothetical protein
MRIKKAYQNRMWRGIIYISRVNWKSKRTLTDEEVNQEIDKCLRMVNRKGNIHVIDVLKSKGEAFPKDPVFNDFKMHAVNRKFDCVVVPALSHFASNYPLANSWVQDVLIPCGFRYLDAGACFDSLTCNHEKYFKRKLSEVYVHDKGQETFEINSKRLVPYGYIYKPEAPTHVIIDPETAPAVKLIFKMRSEGAFVKEIVEKLNDSGFKTPGRRRCELYTPSCRINDTWSNPMVVTILSNPFYTGDYVPTRCSKKNGNWLRKDRKQWKIYSNHHEALVKRSTFNKIWDAHHYGHKGGELRHG